MQANVGRIDRAFRLLAGLGLIAAALFGVIGTWGWIGLIPLATGLFPFVRRLAVWPPHLPNENNKPPRGHTCERRAGPLRRIDRLGIEAARRRCAMIFPTS